MTYKTTGHLTLPLQSIEESERFRLRIPPTRLEALAESIRAHGQIVPLFVRENGLGTSYLIAGYRRRAALELLGAATLVSVFDDDAYDLAVTDNMIARPLNRSELARAEKRSKAS
jgi:ParB family transcriptional regulator, chromosome partitioning protein